MGHQVHQPTPGSGSAVRVEYLFTLSDVDFAAVVPAWLALYERASTACGVLFGLKYIISQGYAGTRLLSAASSAEALHQSLHDSTPYPQGEFRELLKKTLSAFPGKAGVEVSSQVHPGMPNQPHDLPGPRAGPRCHTGPRSSGLTDSRR